jgi:phosphate transport system substrate-binding protein
MICVGAAVFGVAASVGVAEAAAATTITENGSSLVYPLVSQWKAYYTAASISPTSSSSGTGIGLIENGGVNIGASDAPMTADQYGGDKAGAIQIPWALSATGIGYNIPGVKGGLKLNATILAGIYTGKITKWNNKAIVKLNPKLKKALGKAPAITAVIRSGGSGDTYAFQHFLAVADPKGWGATNYSTNWDGGSHTVAENGNSGVAGEVANNPGTIGYISAYYLISQRITSAAVENAAGKFELPEPAAIKDAAASNSTIPAQGANFSGVSIVYPKKKYSTAYPISTYTYAIVNKGESNASALQAFLGWAITKGQAYGGSLDFVPLPSGIVSADQSLISSI